MATKKLTLAKPALEPVRFSRLRLMAKSPAHYAANSVEETGPMRKGSALHAYLLGGESRVVVYRGGRRDKRIEAWREFQAEHAGKHILSPSELATVEGMRRSIERHRRAMDLLDDGIQEQRITWDFNGRACAGTPDVIKPSRGKKRIVELKACHTTEPERFMSHADKCAYHAQVAWYGEGAERCKQYEAGPVDETFVVAVEDRAPYLVTVFRVHEKTLERGRRLWRGWFERLLVSEQANHFPGYAEGDVVWNADERDGYGLDWGDAAE